MSSSAPSDRHRIFKLVFVPLLVFSLLAQLAIVWTQMPDIRDGYFDFVLYYSGAKILNDGNGKQLYNLEVQREYQKVFPGRNDRDLPFNHLPYELLPLTILAKFSFLVAHILWVAINVFLLAIVLLRLFPFVQVKDRPLFALMLLAYFPTITTLKMGQDSIITTFLLIETWVSLKGKRDAIAGGLLSLGLYKPQFVLPLIGIFLLHRRWSLLLGFVFMASLLGGVSLLMVGWEGLMGLLSLWVPMIQRGNVVWPELMVNLRGLTHVTLDLVGLSDATNILTLALSVVVFVITLQLWPRDTDNTSELFDLRFSLSVLMTALVSFHLYSYDGTLLAIPVVIMLSQILKQPGPYSARHNVFLAALIAWFLPLVPNVLLSAAMLAWWALPLPVVFGVVGMEIWRRSPARSLSFRI